MSLSLFDQITEQFQHNDSYLIVLKRHASIDAISCAFALHTFLTSHKKQAVIVSDQFQFPKQLSFLGKTPFIHSSISELKKYRLDIYLGESTLEDISYEVRDETLSIVFSPKQEELPEQQLQLKKLFPHIDTIIAIDIQDLEALGHLYTDNIDLFYQTPIINIDHVAANEQFGQINIVELTALSTTEILYNYFSGIADNIIDEKIASYLLCGIISKTKSFKQLNLTPKALNMVADLIAKGAQREEIVSHLYQTKTISTLKLWGRVLARIQQDPQKQIAWSSLSRKDFVKSGVNSEDDLGDVIDEFISQHLPVSTIALFFESIKGSIGCILHSSSLDAHKSKLTQYQPERTNGFIKFYIPESDIQKAQQQVLSLI